MVVKSLAEIKREKIGRIRQSPPPADEPRSQTSEPARRNRREIPLYTVRGEVGHLVRFT